MKFNIETSDFWLDEDSELAPALKQHITQSVVRDISERIKDKVEKEISSKIKEAVESKLSLVIDSVMADLMATSIITCNGKETTIEKFIKDRFMNSSGWGNPRAHIDKIAKEFGEELKLQYNNAFATRIVANMKEQGFLKKEVVQILLEKGS